MSSTTLAHLCDLVQGHVAPQEQPAAVYFGLEHLAPGRLLPTGRGTAAKVLSSKTRFLTGDVLYGKLRPYLDKAILAECDGVCTTELLVVRPKPGISGRYLACLVHSPEFIRHAVAGTTGAHHPRTSWHHIREFELPTFAKAERDGIANLAWTVHQALVMSEVAVSSAEHLKRVAMRELFTRGLRCEVQAETDIGFFPSTWDVVALGSLGRLGNGSTPTKGHKAYWDGGTYPWLTSAKVYDRDINSADQFVTQTALNECHLPQLQPGSVLVAITGQGKTLGHCAVLRMSATINQHLAYLDTNTSIANPSFVRGYLETQYDYLRQVASGGGSTKGALTCAFLRAMKIPFPRKADGTADLQEQDEIVAVLDAIDHRVELHKKKRAVLEDLFKSLLHKLMTGEIRVSDLDLSALEQSIGPAAFDPSRASGSPRARSRGDSAQATEAGRQVQERA